MVRDLSDALERAQEESRRSRALGELGSTIDLDEVVARTLDVANTIGGVDAVVVAVGTGGEPLTAAVRPRRRRSAERDRRPAGRVAAPVDLGRVRLRPRRRRRAPSRSAPGSAVPLASHGRAARLPLGVLPFRHGTRSARRAPPSSRSSRSAPARRSTTPGAFARHASSPISTRSPACTTVATSTRRSPARSPAPSATAAAWRSSSSTSTTSRRSTTASATSPATASSPRRPTASATSSARPTSRAASAATSSR